MTLTSAPGHGSVAPAEPHAAPSQPNDLSPFWLPFTPNASFKRDPRMVVRAKGMHYYTAEGRAVMDATSGLWCCNAGHGRERIISAIQATAAEIDYAPNFSFGHPLAFEAAARIAALAPGDLDHVFFANSGSEAVDSALKIALAYHQMTGEKGRTRLIGRERGYHGVNFAGISVGGILKNRKTFRNQLAEVDHLPHTYDHVHQAFTKGEPDWGAERAEALINLVELHGAESIAAVIVEPMAGSTGVLPPPKGYLQRLRELCDQYGILLIFDEVITGFGRVGAAFAAERYGVQPDMITFAKGVTSGAVPMGGVIVRKHVYEAFAEEQDHQIKLFHGYTYSGHPLACAAAIAAIETYREDGLFERAMAISPLFEEGMHSLREEAGVIDIRNCGMAAAIDLEGDPADPGRRAYHILKNAFHDHDLMIRAGGDTIILCPPLIATEDQIGEIVEKLRAAMRATP